MGATRRVLHVCGSPVQRVTIVEVSRQIHVTHSMRPAQLAAKTIELLGKGDVLWVGRPSGRRSAAATIKKATEIVSNARPDAKRPMELHEGNDVLVSWSTSTSEWEGVGYFITSRPEHYKVREVDGGDLEAYRVDSVD